MKSSTYYFYVNTEILADFQICISAPLSFKNSIYLKENVEHSQAERITNSYQEINFVKNIKEVEALFWTFVGLAAL